MTFKCFEVATGKYLGTCTLAHRQYDPVGTEHRFGDIDYVLIGTMILGSTNLMNFRRKNDE